jgi:hypothetical protein
LTEVGLNAASALIQENMFPLRRLATCTGSEIKAHIFYDDG